MTNYLMGIDLGTTSVKVSLFRGDGQLISSKSSEYPILTPKAGFAEQNPDEWWQGFLSACHFLVKEFPEEIKNLVGIGLCGQMHTQVYLDGNFQVLRPAITWMDQRSGAIVERINADPTSKNLIFNQTNNIASTTYTAPHIRWVIENEPETWSKVRHILVAKDYLKYLLTGVQAIDYAEASGTLLFDVSKQVWSQDVFDFFEIPRNYFPEALPSDEVIGHITAEAAKLTGLPEGVAVVNGSSDNSASALGSGMTQSGQVTLILGTAGVITVCSSSPLVDQLGRTLCWHYCLRDHWVSLGIMQTAGESLEWFKNTFDPVEEGQTSGEVFNQYNRLIADAPEGSHGLTFLPYLNGERTPYWDASARGVFFGINLKTTKAHMIRSIMEGVSFAFRNNIETVESLGIQIDEVRAVGGGLRSKIWLEILGKVLRRPIATVSDPDTANLGNILLAQKALGMIDDYHKASDGMVHVKDRVHFPDGSEHYEKQYPLFLELYHSLKLNFRYLTKYCES